MAQIRSADARPARVDPIEVDPVAIDAVRPATGETTPDEARQDSDFHRPRLPNGPEGEVRMPAAKARQGVIAGRIIIVLCAGIVLVVLAFLVSYLGAV